MILEGIDGLPSSLLDAMSNDLDFQANSRRVRLEALSGYVTTQAKQRSDCTGAVSASRN